MCGYAWLCVAMRGYAWLCVAMRGYVWLCMAMHGDEATGVQVQWPQPPLCTCVGRAWVLTCAALFLPMMSMTTS